MLENGSWLWINQDILPPPTLYFEIHLLISREIQL